MQVGRPYYDTSTKSCVQPKTSHINQPIKPDNYLAICAYWPKKIITHLAAI